MPKASVHAARVVSYIGHARPNGVAVKKGRRMFVVNRAIFTMIV
jgi:hypothetical protein